MHTPDIHTDRMVNIWNVCQLLATFNFSRSASYFESGIGRGMGFRDSNQDFLGFVHLMPDQARQRILDLAATQLPTVELIININRSPNEVIMRSAWGSMMTHSG